MVNEQFIDWNTFLGYADWRFVQILDSTTQESLFTPKLNLALNLDVYAIRQHKDLIIVKFANINLVKFYRDGRIIISAGGWRTPKIQHYLTVLASVTIINQEGTWRINYNGELRDFVDGIDITAKRDGTS